MATLDLYLVDETLEQSLLRKGVPLSDGVRQLGSQFIEGFFGQKRSFGRFRQLGQLRLTGSQLGGPGTERLDSFATLALGHRAGLEGEQVALDGVFGLGQLGIDGNRLGLMLRPDGACSDGTTGQGLIEQVGTTEGVEERVEDGGVQRVGR